MAKPIPAVEKFQDAKNEWRWRVRARNGKIIAVSGEGYKTEHGIDKAIVVLMETIAMIKSHRDVETQFDIIQTAGR